MERNLAPHLEVVDGLSLAGTPRFNLGAHSILFGPYDSPTSHDKHLSETTGSGDVILDSTDEIRFDRSSVLTSLRVSVPEKPASDTVFPKQLLSLPAKPALLACRRNCSFQLVVGTHAYVDRNGQTLTVFTLGGPTPSTRIRVAVDLDLALADGQIVGLTLHKPAQYLVQGWEQPVVGDDDHSELAVLMSEYLRLIDDQFVISLEDGNPKAHESLIDILFRAEHLPPSSQRLVLSQTIRTVIETFFAPS